MHSKKLLSCAVPAFVVGMFVAAPSPAAGPLSEYFLTNGDQGTNWIVQGSTASSYAQQHTTNQGEYAIVVTDTVRTLNNGNCGGVSCGLGSQYTLGGVYNGTDYPYPAVTASFYDGASDGTNNYSVDYGSGGVYRMNADWSNPVLLFPTAINNLGITYDPTDSTLWVSQFSGNQVLHYSLTGTLLGSFAAAQPNLSSLALDPADGTLWMGSQNTKGTFYQYSKLGVLLGTETYASMAGQNTLGGEFAVSAAAIPEPSTYALMLAGLGLVGFVASRRRGARPPH